MNSASHQNEIYSEPLGMSVNDQIRVDWIGRTTRDRARREPVAVPFHGLVMVLEGTAHCHRGGEVPVLARAPFLFLFNKGQTQLLAHEPEAAWRARYMLLTGGWVADWVRFGWWPRKTWIMRMGRPGEAERVHQDLMDSIARKDAPGLERAKLALIPWLHSLRADHSQRAGSGISAKLDGLVAQWRRDSSHDWDLNDCARRCGLSYSRFRAAFKQRYGVAPYRHLLQLRIERAQTLLIGTDLRIKEISWQVGFRNVETFVRHFSKALGVPPTRYRAQTHAIP